MDWDDVYDLVQEQAADPGIWFQAQTITEAYLQEQLRRLHAVIESAHRGKDRIT